MRFNVLFFLCVFSYKGKNWLDIEKFAIYNQFDLIIFSKKYTCTSFCHQISHVQGFNFIEVFN